LLTLSSRTSAIRPVVICAVIGAPT
jgi:hypothetical protein